MPEKKIKFGTTEAPANEGMTSRPAQQTDKNNRPSPSWGGSEQLNHERTLVDKLPANVATQKAGIRWKLILICGGLAILVLVIMSSASKNDSAHSQSPQPTVEVNTSAQGLPPESTPTTGSKIPLTYQELVFCLAEDIRLDAAIKVQNKVNLETLRKRIDRYNEECVNANYYTKDMELAEPQVNAFRSTYTSEGEALVTPNQETYVSVYVTEERTGGGFGKGLTVDAAKSAALKSCQAKYPKSLCIERLSGAGRCVAVANDASGRKVSAGIGETASIAESNAIRLCNQSYQSCQIPSHQSVCNIN